MLVLYACLVRLMLSAVLLFGAAGTVDWMRGWLLLFTVSGGAAIGQILLIMKNPALACERLCPGDGQPPSDRRLYWAIALMFNFWLMAMALEVRRFGLQPMGAWLAWPGLLLALAGQGLSFAAQWSNPFAAAVVRIQSDRGHRVVSAGPYRFIRHPMYGANFLVFSGGALLVGSLAGLVMTGLFAALFILRIRIEESALMEGLPQYAAYSRCVRWRLIPFLW